MGKNVSKVAAIRDQRAQMEYERRWWEKLTALAEADDVAGFYTMYAAYLKENRIISDSRRVLHTMAVRAAEKLRAAETEN